MTTHDLTTRRVSYDSTTLDDGTSSDPFELFDTWLGEAVTAQDRGASFEAAAMTLATARPMPDGTWQPQTRVVLLKKWDEDGFVLFTNYDSDKAHAVDANPRACLHFHWTEMFRQVRIDGTVSRTSREVSEEYFASRPRGSQIAAWASRQSESVGSRTELETEYQRMEQRFAGSDVPCPPDWGGLLVRPERMEFWQGRASRLHDRIVFTRTEAAWDITRLCP